MAKPTQLDELLSIKSAIKRKLFSLDSLGIIYLMLIGFLRIITVILAKIWPKTFQVATLGPAIMILIYGLAMSVTIMFANKLVDLTYLEGRYTHIIYMIMILAGLFAAAYFIPGLLPGIMQSSMNNMFSAIGLP